MRVVIVHNHYRTGVPSGENAVVENIGAQLASAGIEVVRFERHSDDIVGLSLARKALLPLAPIHSFEAQGEFDALVGDARPDVVQFHNLFPLISPSVLNVASRYNVPVLHFVHNYRHICLAGSLRRNGADCTLCPETGSVRPAVWHACYRGSRMQTAIMAASTTWHRRSWSKVYRFVAVSNFVRERLIQGGLPANRIVVSWNGVRDPGPVQPIPRSATFLFAGRLDEDKGVNLILEAWRRSRLGTSRTLEIAGTGPLASTVERAAARLPGVVALGRLGPAGMADAYRRASVVVVPSLWQDPAPLIAMEALSHGRPVIATAVGGLPEIIDDSVGWLAMPNAESLAKCLQIAAKEYDGVLRRARGARLRYEAAFTLDGWRQRLVDLHSEAADAGMAIRSAPRSE